MIMPPKAKSSKSGGKAGKSRRGSAESKPEEDVLEELNEQYFILHIQDLERRYKRYQEKIARLEKENKELLDEKTSLSDDKKERIRFLKESLEKRRDEIADLYDRLEGLQQTKDAEKDMFESQFQRIRAEFQETKDQLSSENNILAAKLAALEEFKRQKEILLERYNALEKRLEDMKDEQENNLAGVDRKMTLDRDRLKKEMVHRVNQVAADFRKVSNKQMADTTKRLIRENVSIQTQLVKMADKVAEIVQENEELQKKSRQNRRDIKRHENDQEMYARKNSSHLKIIHMLNIRRDKDIELLELYEKQQDDLIALEEETEKLRQMAADIRIQNLMAVDDVANLQLECRSQQESLAETHAGIEESKDRLVDAIMALKDILQHSPVVPTLDKTLSASSSMGNLNPVADADKLLNNLINSLNPESENAQDQMSEVSSISDGRTVVSSSLAKSVSIPPSRQSTRAPSGVLRSMVQQQHPAQKGTQFTSGKVIPPLSSGADTSATQGKPDAATRPEPMSAILQRNSKRSQQGYCVPGCLQLVPSATQKIPTQLEKSRRNHRLLEAQSKREKELWNQLLERHVPFPHKSQNPEESLSKKASVQTQSVVKAAALAEMKPSLLSQFS